jgi:molybdopterin-containing oxidoreductase family iron-sulfur binding subunit
MEFSSFWKESLKRGGAWGFPGDGPSAGIRSTAFSFPAPPEEEEKAKGFHFTAYPTIQFFDGREANRLWVQEFPDPMTQTTWGAWVEMNPETAAGLGVRKGDMIRIKSPFGTVEAPVLPIATVLPGTLAMPVGQGHTDYGRYATGVPANPMVLFPNEIDPITGAILRPPFKVAVEKTKEVFEIAHTDGSFTDHGREILETVSLGELTHQVSSGHSPHIIMPLPEGYDNVKDFYQPHEHKDYRWSMVVDLDRCIGCGACVMACYAENNVGIVGREQVLKGREMSWIRAQRYFSEDMKGASWLVMLCQHCDAAPCEAVCPVFAPHHSKEGLNNQVYNRCFGTRFCSQNDPYKVRRFNWFTFTREESLKWQLNPDVTVRQKGVMEKCSFCIQRIVAAKAHARNEGRKVKDGDFTTACAQTCPTNALVFGNLLDPESRVSRMISNPRVYQVLGHLNTKPAVFYLKKVTQDIVNV